MSPNRSENKESSLKVGNYAVAFIDLLGQRAALRGEGLLPDAGTEESQKRLMATLKASIGSITSLQKHAEDMMQASAPKEASALRAQLSPDEQKLWDEVHQEKIQRWSDGLMIFTCLGDEDIKCPINAVYRLFTLAGSLCYIGLASKRPLRGAIEIAWGVELHPGELYGAAVARSYELESEVADYPRIVVGPQMLHYLDQLAFSSATDFHSRLSAGMANLCRSMLIQDADGHWLLHYLGDQFIDTVTYAHHQELYKKSHAFIIEQLEMHRKNHNSKLAFRYLHLLQYFQSHALPSDQEAA
jgi:hypothetical protein